MMLSLSPFVRSSVHLSFFSLLFLDFVVHLECQGVESFKAVSMKFQGCVEGISKNFKVCFKEISKVF